MLKSGLNPTKQVAKFIYDFSKYGGAQGNIVVQGHGIPAGALITGGLIDVEYNLAGAGASVAFKAQNAGDVLAATAITGMSMNALLDTVPNNTAEQAIRLSGAINCLIFSISGADLTSGRIAVALEYT